jgi:hypothetical protein
MLSSWWYAVDVSKGNKENVVTGMASLSIMDDMGSKKLAGGLNEPNGEYPQFVGSTPCQSILLSTLPTNSVFEAETSYGGQHASTYHPHNDNIESLRKEFLGMTSGQADDISTLRSSNAKLKSNSY